MLGSWLFDKLTCTMYNVPIHQFCIIYFVNTNIITILFYIIINCILYKYYVVNKCLMWTPLRDGIINNFILLMSIVTVDDIIHMLLLSPNICQRRGYNRLNHAQNVIKLIMSKSMLLILFLFQIWLYGKFSRKKV